MWGPLNVRVFVISPFRLVVNRFVFVSSAKVFYKYEIVQLTAHLPMSITIIHSYSLLLISLYFISYFQLFSIMLYIYVFVLYSYCNYANRPNRVHNNNNNMPE